MFQPINIAIMKKIFSVAVIGLILSQCAAPEKPEESTGIDFPPKETTPEEPPKRRGLGLTAIPKPEEREATLKDVKNTAIEAIKRMVDLPGYDNDKAEDEIIDLLEKFNSPSFEALDSKMYREFIKAINVRMQELGIIEK